MKKKKSLDKVIADEHKKVEDRKKRTNKRHKDAMTIAILIKPKKGKS